MRHSISYRRPFFFSLLIPIVATGFLVDETKAAVVSIDLDSLPDNTVLDTQFSNIGVLFDARRSTDSVLGAGTNINPIVDFSGFLFYNPDIAGAVGIIRFVEPNTTISLAGITAFSAQADANFDSAESIELVAFDINGNQIASDITLGPEASGGLVDIQSSVPFAFLEIRTNGDPGIALNNLTFTTIPEPSSILLLGLSSLGLALRRFR